jgi:hypothetical protein
MQRQGVEDAKGKTPPADQSKKVRRRPSKAELREQAEAAFGAKPRQPKTNSAPSLR